MGTIVDGAAKAKKMEPKLPNWLIEGIEKCNLSPLSPVLGHMYIIEPRVYSPVPSITNHKAVRHQITKHGRSNHHFTLCWLCFSIVFFEKPSHRTKLDGWRYCVLVVIHASFGSTEFLDANKVVFSACRQHLRTTYHGLPQWCSPSNALRQTTMFDISSMSPQWGRKSNIVTTSIFLYTRPVYQNYNLQKATNTNRGTIDGVCLILATKDINIPSMHAEVRRLVCMALH